MRTGVCVSATHIHYVVDLVVAQRQHLQLAQRVQGVDPGDPVVEQAQVLQVHQAVQALDDLDVVEGQIWGKGRGGSVKRLCCPVPGLGGGRSASEAIKGTWCSAGRQLAARPPHPRGKACDYFWKPHTLTTSPLWAALAASELGGDRQL